MVFRISSLMLKIHVKKESAILRLTTAVEFLDGIFYVLLGLRVHTQLKLYF